MWGETQTTMNVKEKAGDFMLDIAKLIFGGVILASIIAEDLDKTWIYILGSFAIIICCGFAFTLYKLSKKKGD